MKFPVVVQLIKSAPIWEPRCGCNFWRVGDVSRALGPETDFSAIRYFVERGVMRIVAGSIDEDPVEIPVVEIPQEVIQEVLPEAPKPKRAVKKK